MSTAAGTTIRFLIEPVPSVKAQEANDTLQPHDIFLILRELTPTQQT